MEICDAASESIYMCLKFKVYDTVDILIDYIDRDEFLRIIFSKEVRRWCSDDDDFIDIIKRRPGVIYDVCKKILTTNESRSYSKMFESLVDFATFHELQLEILMNASNNIHGRHLTGILLRKYSSEN